MTFLPPHLIYPILGVYNSWHGQSDNNFKDYSAAKQSLSNSTVAVYSKRLDASVNSRLVIVCAPAGYGKTSLLREWLYEKDDSIAWFSIEPNDNDIVQFLTYLLSALQSAFPRIISKT